MKPQVALWVTLFSTGFSPVAGILLVETSAMVPPAQSLMSFSPVAGILLVETSLFTLLLLPIISGFSPVAGILLVETVDVL